MDSLSPAATPADTEAIPETPASLPDGARRDCRRPPVWDAVDRQVHDPGQRAPAALIERDHPLWVVLYGPYTRAFYAFPWFAAPPGTMVAAPAPAPLLASMQAPELTYCRTARLPQP